MNIEVMRNSISHAVLGHHPDDVKGIVDAIMLVLIVEAWPYTTADTPIRLRDLSDSEFRLVVTWFHMTRNQYDNKIRHIKDMREMFPGLGLAACNEIVRG